MPGYRPSAFGPAMKVRIGEPGRGMSAYSVVTIICLLAGDSGEDMKGSQLRITIVPGKQSMDSKIQLSVESGVEARSNGRSTSEYEVSKRDHREGQHGSRQNRKHAPDPKLRIRFRQTQHVNGRVVCAEVIDLMSVPGSARHRQMLARKAAHFSKTKALLTTQNGTFTTHLQPGRTSGARATVASPTYEVQNRPAKCLVHCTFGAGNCTLG